MIIWDTGPLVTATDADDKDHARCVELMRRTPRPLLVPYPVLHRGVLPAGAGEGHPGRGGIPAVDQSSATDPLPASRRRRCPPCPAYARSPANSYRANCQGAATSVEDRTDRNCAPVPAYPLPAHSTCATQPRSTCVFAGQPQFTWSGEVRGCAGLLPSPLPSAAPASPQIRWGRLARDCPGRRRGPHRGQQPCGSAEIRLVAPLHEVPDSEPLSVVHG